MPRKVKLNIEQKFFIQILSQNKKFLVLTEQILNEIISKRPRSEKLWGTKQSEGTQIENSSEPFD